VSFWLRLPAILVACCLAAGCGDCLYRGHCTDPDHFSVDPTPLQIDLKREKPGSTRTDAFAQLRVPRSYVVFANHHDSRKGPLPERFATNHFAIKFIEGGEAWNVAFDRLRKIKGSELADRELRPNAYRVYLGANANPNWRTDHQASLASDGVRQPAGYEGLIHYSGGQEVYVGDPSDAFTSIKCSKPSHPGVFCTYSIPITEKISANATFVDFRRHGGREYANRRARFIRETVCKFTDCDANEPDSGIAAARPYIGDQKRSVCIARDIPQKIVTMGLETNVASEMPAAVTQQTFWRLRVPAYFHAQDAWPRTSASRILLGAVLYPEMVPAAQIDGELRQEWLTVPVDDDERPAFLPAPRNTPCLVHAEISFEELAERKIYITVRPPGDYPQTFTAISTPRCGEAGMSHHICVIHPLLDGWHVDVSFRSKWRDAADDIRERVKSYLDRITLSRDPVPVASAPTQN